MNKPNAQAVKNIKAALANKNHPAWDVYRAVFSTRSTVDAATLTNAWCNHLEWLAIAGKVEKVYLPGGLAYVQR